MRFNENWDGIARTNRSAERTVGEDLSSGSMVGLHFEKRNNPLRAHRRHGNKESEAKYALAVHDPNLNLSMIGWIIPSVDSKGRITGYVVYDPRLSRWGDFLVSTHGTAGTALKKAKEYALRLKVFGSHQEGDLGARR